MWKNLPNPQRWGQFPERQITLCPTLPILDQHNCNCPSSPQHYLPTHISSRSFLCHQGKNSLLKTRKNLLFKHWADQLPENLLSQPFSSIPSQHSPSLTPTSPLLSTISLPTPLEEAFCPIRGQAFFPTPAMSVSFRHNPKPFASPHYNILTYTCGRSLLTHQRWCQHLKSQVWLALNHNPRHNSFPYH